MVFKNHNGRAHVELYRGRCVYFYGASNEWCQTAKLDSSQL